MEIANINNLNFGKVTYEGHYGKYNYGPFVFRPDECFLLSSEQDLITRIAEDKFIGKSNNYLDSRLDSQKDTDVRFSYGYKKMSIELKKRVTNSCGDEYAYTPYNEKGNKKLKVNFDLSKPLSIKNIKNQITRLVKESNAYLKSDTYSRNKEIEMELS